MFLLVNPDNNVVIKISNTCIPIMNIKGEYVECDNSISIGYLIDDDLIYLKSLPIVMYELNNIPDEVKPYKYLYIDNRFVINEDYKDLDLDFKFENIKQLENEINDIRSNKSNSIITEVFLKDNILVQPSENIANSFNINIPNYLPIGILGVNISDASEEGTNSLSIYLNKFYIDNNSIQYGFTNNSIDIAKIKIQFTILFIKK